MEIYVQNPNCGLYCTLRPSGKRCNKSRPQNAPWHFSTRKFAFPEVKSTQKLHYHFPLTPPLCAHMKWAPVLTRRDPWETPSSCVWQWTLPSGLNGERRESQSIRTKFIPCLCVRKNSLSTPCTPAECHLLSISLFTCLNWLYLRHFCNTFHHLSLVK